MHIHTVREVLARRSEELQKHVTAKKDRGLSNIEIAQEDPFLMGQIYALTSLMIELGVLQEEESERWYQARNQD